MVPSGIDKEKLNLQLERLDELVRLLKEAKERLAQSPHDNLLLSGVERILQILSEECINIGQHLISGLNLARPDSYREIFLRLDEAGIITKNTGKRMMELASFRNRLVHLYWQVARDEALAWLSEAGLFRRFAVEVYEYLKRQGLI